MVIACEINSLILGGNTNTCIRQFVTLCYLLFCWVTCGYIGLLVDQSFENNSCNQDTSLCRQCINVKC